MYVCQSVNNSIYSKSQKDAEKQHIIQTWLLVTFLFLGGYRMFMSCHSDVDLMFTHLHYIWAYLYTVQHMTIQKYVCVFHMWNVNIGLLGLNATDSIYIHSVYIYRIIYIYSECNVNNSCTLHNIYIVHR